MEYHGNNDWRDYALLHSWGTKPEQKKREKEYNRQYWLDHKDEILRKRKKGSNNAKITVSSVVDKAVKAASKNRIDDVTDISKNEAYNAVLENMVAGYPKRQLEDANEFWVAMYEEGVELSKEEAAGMYKKYKYDLRKQVLAKETKVAPKKTNQSQPKVSKEYLQELEYNSKKNKF